MATHKSRAQPNMTSKKALIDLKSFSTPEFKCEFQINRSLQLDFLEICSNHIEYAFEILDEDPLRALEIMRELNDFHDVLGTMPHEILDLSVAVVLKFGILDMEYAITLIDEIQEEPYKIDAAIELLRRTESEKYINEIAKKIRVLDDERVQEFEKALEHLSISNLLKGEKIII